MIDRIAVRQPTVIKSKRTFKESVKRHANGKEVSNQQRGSLSLARSSISGNLSLVRRRKRSRLGHRGMAMSHTVIDWFANAALLGEVSRALRAAWCLHIRQTTF